MKYESNNIPESVTKFEKYLRRTEKSEATIKSYLYPVVFFYKKYGIMNKTNLLLFKEELMRKNKPSTVMLRITSMNQYLIFIKKRELMLLNINVPTKTFLDNVISQHDYLKLKRNLLRDGYIRDYYLIWLIATTGSRISEALSFTIQDIQNGYMDVYSKGRHRRIYVIKKVQIEMLQWLKEENRENGYVFLNKNGIHISVSGVGCNFRKYAQKYHIPEKDIHPHAFRHRFALNYIANCKSAAGMGPSAALLDLANILGHKSTQTTQIYTTKTASEYEQSLNKIVSW